MQNEAVLIAAREIPIPYGSFYILDEGYGFGTTSFVQEHLHQGFKRHPNGAVILSPYDYARANVRVYKGPPVISNNSIRAVTFPIELSSGSMLIGDEWERCDVVLQLDFDPGSYLVTVAQEILAEDIDEVQGSALMLVSIFLQTSDAITAKGKTLIMDRQRIDKDELIAADQQEASF